VIAVDDVSVNIEQGQFVTLLGPSGCGKTTTLRLIAGFEFPTQGSIVLDGETINEQPPNVRDMAMVFQSYAIFPHLNVFENIAYGLKIQKMSRAEISQQVDRALAMTELEGLEERSPNQLSGGQQQRVALARALVMQPKVLLFDEPLSNLDAKLRVQMRSEIRRIQQELGITSVYVTHDQDEAMVLSDLIIVMDAGKIQQVGSAVDIYRRPVNRFVADFIGQANFLPVQVEGDNQVRLFGKALTLPAPTADNTHPTAMPARSGAEALLLARPESIQIHTTEPTDSSGIALAGQVQRIAYLGSLVEYDIVLEDGSEQQSISAAIHNPGERELFPVGSAVWVALLPDNLYLLPSP